jgi:2-methylcitrate dehydratase PrpD
MTGSTIAERLGTFAADLRVDALPLVVGRRAKACLLHALAVGMAGSAAGFGQRAELTSQGSERRPDLGGYARSLLTGRWHPATSAAFINGVHLHARAQEDTHGTFHPGVSVIPAVLAAAESDDVDGATFLAAVVAGYEVGIALSDPLTELTTPPFRATAVFGAVAAAAGAGRIRGLGAERMASALSIATAMSGGDLRIVRGGHRRMALPVRSGSSDRAAGRPTRRGRRDWLTNRI